jgi:hypothetical protein
MSQLVEQSGFSGESRFRCGDGEALMTYVYGESSPAERDTIAAHLVRCGACTEEVAAIGATREHLAAWTPPLQTLGFQITSRPEQVPATDDIVEPAAGATILRPAAWWSRPLPAWGQMAAAAVIFASGLAIGMARGGSPAPPATVARTAVAPAAVTASTTQTPVTREELARLEQRLTGQIAQVRTAAPVAAEPTAATIQRVSQMIAASERRQEQELNFRTAQIVTDVANRRTIDMNNIERRLTAQAVSVQSTQQNFKSMAQRVGFMPANSPYVP